MTIKLSTISEIKSRLIQDIAVHKQAIASYRDKLIKQITEYNMQGAANTFIELQRVLNLATSKQSLLDVII